IAFSLESVMALAFFLASIIWLTWLLISEICSEIFSRIERWFEKAGSFSPISLIPIIFWISVFWYLMAGGRIWLVQSSPMIRASIWTFLTYFSSSISCLASSSTWVNTLLDSKRCLAFSVTSASSARGVALIFGRPLFSASLVHSSL